MIAFLTALHILVCLFLIVVVLLQRGKGSDIGAALGGGGGNTVFGSRGAANFLTRLTTASAVLFMGTSLALSMLMGGATDSLFDDASEAEVQETLSEVEQGETDLLEEVEVEDAGGLEEVTPENDGAAGDGTDE